MRRRRAGANALASQIRNRDTECTGAGKDCLWFSDYRTRGKVVRAVRASTPARAKARAFACVCLAAGPSGRPLTARHDAGTRTLRDGHHVMQIHQAMLHHQVIHVEAADRLATTRQLIDYLTAGTPDLKEESLWLACLNPNRRPICRTRIKAGVLVAARVDMRDVFLPLLLAEARAFACLRTQPEGAAQPGMADGRLIWNLRETARLMNIEFVDYFIVAAEGHGRYSWRENARERE